MLAWEPVFNWQKTSTDCLRLTLVRLNIFMFYAIIKCIFEVHFLKMIDFSSLFECFLSHEFQVLMFDWFLMLSSCPDLMFNINKASLCYVKEGIKYKKKIMNFFIIYQKHFWNCQKMEHFIDNVFFKHFWNLPKNEKLKISLNFFLFLKPPLKVSPAELCSDQTEDSFKYWTHLTWSLIVSENTTNFEGIAQLLYCRTLKALSPFFKCKM